MAASLSYRSMAVKTRTHFTFRVGTWTPDGESILEHIAGVEDYQVALASFRAACERWPSTPITLRQGARVIEDSPAEWGGDDGTYVCAAREVSSHPVIRRP